MSRLPNGNACVLKVFKKGENAERFFESMQKIVNRPDLEVSHIESHDFSDNIYDQPWYRRLQQWIASL